MRLSKKNQKAFEEMIQDISVCAQLVGQKKAKGDEHERQWWSNELQIAKNKMRESLGIDLINTI